MSKDLSDKWGYGAGRGPMCVDPRSRPEDSVPRLRSGRWAPVSQSPDAQVLNRSPSLPPANNGNGNSGQPTFAERLSARGAGPTTARSARNGNGSVDQLSRIVAPVAERPIGEGPAKENFTSNGFAGESRVRSERGFGRERNVRDDRASALERSARGERSSAGEGRARGERGTGSQGRARSERSVVDRSPQSLIDAGSVDERATNGRFAGERLVRSERGADDERSLNGNGDSSIGSGPVVAERFNSDGGIDAGPRLDLVARVDTSQRRTGQRYSERDRRNGTSRPTGEGQQNYESARARRAQANRKSPITRQTLDTDSSSSARNIVEWAAVIIASVLIALLVQRFLVQAFWIPSSSMMNTLAVQDKVFVDKMGYRIKDINRGDIVVFNKTEDEIGLRPDDPKDVIKRVIGLPGETVHIQDNQVRINGQLLREPYLASDVLTSDFGPSVIPEGHLFVMGDNREHSADSRFGLGPVSEDRVVGRAFITFWPPSRIGGL